MATRQEIETALRNADAAGDTEAATALARAYSQMGQTKAAPADAVGAAHTNPEALGMQGEMGNGFNPSAAVIGAGRFGDKLNQGLRQAKLATQYAVQRLLPGDSTATLDAMMEQKEAEAEKDRHFQKLETQHPGSVAVGQIAPMLAAGPGTMVTAAATEYGSPLERAGRVAATVAGNKMAQVAGKAITSKIDDMAAAKTANAVRDSAVTGAKEAGYVALPSEVGGSVTGRVIEGLSGKQKAAQLASVKNQPVTAGLIRKAIGVSDEAPLTLETTKAVRAEAFDKGYAPVRDWGNGAIRIKPDTNYHADVGALTSRSDNAAQAFGDAAKSDIADLATGLKNAKSFTPSQAIDQIAILREKASDFYAAGNKTAGAAHKKAAEAIENQIERTLARSGKDGVAMLKDYRDSRTLMAKTFDVEKAINRGRDGMPDAATLGKILKKSPGRLTGELRTVAEAANSMPQAMRLPQQGWSNPFTAVDSGVGTLATAISGTPLPLAVPAARVAGRYGLLSGMGQKAFTNPNYEPGLLLKGGKKAIDNEEARRLAGLLGYGYATSP